MRTYLTTAVAAAIALACAVPASADPLAYAPVPRSFDPLKLIPFTEQRASVETGCFDKELKQILSDLGRQFDAVPMVTSGHRKSRNRPGSLHVSCDAADIQIPGVAPSRVAEAARKHPLVGGVGTYCHTKSIHVDTGERRDWNWSCGRSGRKRR
jgi:hypothetical protein